MAHGVTESDAQGPGSLSRKQKRELLQLAAAGCLSVVFIIVPLALVRPTPRPELPRFAAPLTEALPHDSGPMPVRIVRTTVSVEASAPPLAASAAFAKPRTTADRGQRPALVAPPVSALVRIARLFAGDGRHSVQPFPTVPAANR